MSALYQKMFLGEAAVEPAHEFRVRWTPAMERHYLRAISGMACEPPCEWCATATESPSGETGREETQP